MGGQFIPRTDSRSVYFGPHRGIHRIFADMKGFHAYHANVQVTLKWWEAQEGEWFLTSDGHVAQCLKRYTLTNKRGQVTTVIKTCFGSFPYYVRKTDGISNCMCRVEKQRKTRWKNSISSMAKPTTNRYGKHMNGRKKKFAYLWLARGMDPTNAYMMAFGTISHNTARKAALYLIRTEKSNLYNHIAMAYKDLFDSAGLSDEDIAKMIANEAKTARASKDRIEAVKLALELRQELTTGLKGIPPPPVAPPALPPGMGLTAPPQQIEATVIMRELPAPEPPQDAEIISITDTLPTLERQFAHSLVKLGKWRRSRRPSIRPRLKDFDEAGLRTGREDQAA